MYATTDVNLFPFAIQIFHTFHKLVKMDVSNKTDVTCIRFVAFQVNLPKLHI